MWMVGRIGSVLGLGLVLLLVVGLGCATGASPTTLPTARVVKVVDGDTLDVALNGRVERVRLIGVNAPESVDPRRPVQCFGREAAARARELLEGKLVQLEADPSQGDRDQFGRLLRYVWLPSPEGPPRLVNQVLIAEGYAHEYTYNLPYRYQEAFRQAQREARAQQRGLWSPATCNGRP